MRVPSFFPLRLLLGLVLAAALPESSFAAERTKVWITLRDKGPAAAGLSGRAFEDAPIDAQCLQGLRGVGVEVVTMLKWQNRVSGWVDGSLFGTVASLPCVRGVEEMPRKAPASRQPVLPKPAAASSSAASSSTNAAMDFGSFQTLFAAVGAAELRDTVVARGLRAGAGLRIAIMDEDFRLGHQAFDSLYARGSIVDQWDFVGNTAASVSRTLGSSHGAWVLSLIGGELPGVLEGLAPHARFLLYRTENAAGEAYVEEDYLAAALERAVDSGAQVINVSLGYRYDFTSEANVPYSAMNGRTRPSSLAALGAARRGVLVVVAVGNEGLSRFGEPTVTAPSDADSILAVGIEGTNAERCSYSSTGPTFDGRLKPELSSLGCGVPVANTATATGVVNQSGTSFAAPVVAGVAALLKQLHSGSTGGAAGAAQRIRLALMTTAARAGTPDNLTGNGLMRATEAHRALLPPPPVGVKGLYVWRGGATSAFPWPYALNTEKTRAWDVQGRRVRLQGGLDAEGKLLLSAPARRSPSPLILKIPLQPE
jgi:serine protease AprX